LAVERYDWSHITPQLVAAHDLALERFTSGDDQRVPQTR